MGVVEHMKFPELHKHVGESSCPTECHYPSPTHLWKLTDICHMPEVSHFFEEVEYVYIMEHTNAHLSERFVSNLFEIWK